MRVALIETAAQDAPGSMRRYADLISAAFQDQPEIEITRFSVAPTERTLHRLHRTVRTVYHHGMVTAGAFRVSRRHQADIFHVVDGSHAYLVGQFPKGRAVVTAHDIIPELQIRGRFPAKRPGLFARQIISSSLKGLASAAQVMADSTQTMNDVLQFSQVKPNRIRVVPLALPEQCLPPAREPLWNWKERTSQSAPFIFHLGNNGFYKNRLGLIPILSRINQYERIRLVLAGPPPSPALIQLINDHQLTNFVEFVINPDDATVLDLYRRAALFLFPSIYEGFGWPPLEAMAWNCPVVCSTGGSLSEVVGDAALVASADDEEQLARHCLSIIQNEEVATRLMQAGKQRIKLFSLDRFRSTLLEVYRSVANNA